MSRLDGPMAVNGYSHSRGSSITSEDDLITVVDRTRAASPTINPIMDKTVDNTTMNSSQMETWSTKMSRVAKVVLPHVGLVLLLGIYTVCGAGVFLLIEADVEKELRKVSVASIWEKRDFMVNLLWNMTLNATVDEQVWKDAAYRNLEMLEARYYTSFRDEFIVADDIRNIPRSIWTFPTAVFFACTVITTIGYGHIVPQSTVGRLLCIVYGLFGIPLLLITIADIGKFLSDLISLIYQKYRSFKLQVKRRSRKFSSFRRRSQEPNPLPEPPSDTESRAESEQTSSDEIHIPVWMVLLFMAAYTALGGALFEFWEGWTFFEACYFCFITMSTIGFGDFVPTSQVYMLLTMVYIVIGLAITTMCIDLAGTEYIRKIHYFGQKIETAKGAIEGAVATGMHAGGDLVNIVRSAGGRFINVGGDVVLSVKNVAQLRRRGILPPDFDIGDLSEDRYIALSPELLRLRKHALENVLWEPLSPDVERFVKPNMKLRPDEIKESDAWILENKTFERPILQRRWFRSSELIDSRIATTWPVAVATPEYPMFIAPFILKESDV